MVRTTHLELFPGTVSGDHRVHLFAGQDDTSLCLAPRLLAAPASGLHSAACPLCVTRALDDGHTTVRERGNAYVNLHRVGRPVTV